MRILKVGDYVETCHLMPAILQKIHMRDYVNNIDEEIEELSISEDELHDSNIQYDVEVFYPYFQEQYPEYNGGSNCSVKHCGVHRISKERFDLLTSIGEENLAILWRINTPDLCWEDITELYAKDDINIRKHIPIKKVLGKRIVEYKDRQVWECKKRRVVSPNRNKQNYHNIKKRFTKSKRPHTYFYEPITRLK